MSKSAVITARIDPAIAALVDKVAAAHGRSRSWFAAKAIARAAEQEATFAALVQEAIDELDRGEGVPHAVAMAELDAMIEQHEARCRD